MIIGEDYDVKKNESKFGVGRFYADRVISCYQHYRSFVKHLCHRYAEGEDDSNQPKAEITVSCYGDRS